MGIPTKRGGLLPLALAGALVLAAVDAWAQSTSPLRAAPPPADAKLQRQKELKELLSQAREELLFNRNPAAAKEKCLRALAIDPNNVEAQFRLAQAERQLKGEVPTSGATSVPSILPDSSRMADAVARSRRTTATTVIMPSERAAASTAPGLLRVAVVSGKESYVAPRPAPSLSRRVKKLIALGVAVVIVVGTIAMVAGRFLAGKRRGPALAPSSVQEAALAEAPPDYEAPVGSSILGVPEQDDFPIGEGAVADAPMAGPTPPSSAGDSAVDSWRERPEGMGTASPTTAMPGATASGKVETAGSRSTAPGRRGEEFRFEPPRPESVSQPSVSKGKPAATSPPPAVSAPAAGTTKLAPSPPPSPSKAPPKETRPPKPPEGFAIQTPVIEGFGSAEDDEVSALSLEPTTDRKVPPAFKPTEEPVEMVPFSLDMPLEQTEPDTQVTSPPPRAAGVGPVPESEPPLPVRVDDDFPLGSEASAPLPASRSQTPPAGPPTQPIRQESEAPSKRYDEILISAGSRKSEDETALLPTDELTSEATLADGRARQKALCQDQLARGIAAMEDGQWQDAVKFLSIAHAISPDDPHIRNKLREAREKRDQEKG